MNIGEYDTNLDLARKYGIPLSKGVPALVVLDGAGHVLYAQRNAEFENMRVKDASAVTAFLEKWKPRAAHQKHHPAVQTPATFSMLYDASLFCASLACWMGTHHVFSLSVKTHSGTTLKSALWVA